jgi:hypothetical protein
MKVNNPHDGAVHLYINRLAKGVTVKPGASDLSEEDFNLFGDLLQARGVEVLEALNDTAEPASQDPDPTQKLANLSDEKKEPAKKLEKLNDSSEPKKPAGTEKKNEDKLEKINE